MKDTSVVKMFDSTTVIQNDNQHIILIQDFKNKPEKDLIDNPWIISFLIPILVAGIIAFIAHRFGYRKNKIEIDKLMTETERLKKSFQPIVIDTLNSVQNKIIDKKLDALSELIVLRSEFTSFEQIYDEEGEPVFPDEYDYLRHIFLHFGPEKHSKFRKFHDKFSFIFPDKTYGKFQILLFSINEMKNNYEMFQAVYDGSIEPPSSYTDLVRQTILNIDNTIMEIRKDCHLDSSFIHDFIAQNKQ